MRASEDARAYPVQIGGHLIQKPEPKSYDWYTRLPHGHAAPDPACPARPADGPCPDLALPGPNPERPSAPLARAFLTWHATSTPAEGLCPDLALLRPATLRQALGPCPSVHPPTIAPAPVCPLGTSALDPACNQHAGRRALPTHNPVV